MTGGRPRIAFLSRTLHDRTGLELWKGILERCRELDVSVVTLKGAQLGREPASILYHLLSADSYDGFITWASSDADRETIEYYGRLASKPLVCMTFQIPGHPVVVADSKQGMIEITKHFIEKHGHKKIAFVRGPASHVYAKERYEGFLETLRAYNIEPEERLVSEPGGWAPADGSHAIDVFLNERGLLPGKDFDAIITVSDNISIGVMERLQSLGYRIPQDVAVGGYNDTVEAKCTNPPMTSVAMPFQLQGQKGVDYILAMMKGESVEDQFHFPANLVIGQSCGCQSVSVAKAAARQCWDEVEEIKSPFACFIDKFRKRKEQLQQDGSCEDANDWRQHVSSSMKETVLKDMAHQMMSEDMLQELSIELVNAFHNEIAHGKSGEFLTRLSEILRKIIAMKGNLDVWQNVVSDLRAGMLEFVRSKGLLAKSEDLWQQARVMIGETAVRTKESQYLQTVKNEGALRSIGAALITSYDIKGLMDILATSLNKLKIPSFFLALYEDSKYSMENPVCPEFARLILAQNDSGRMDLPEEGLRVSTKELVPANMLPSGRKYSMVVESLHFQDIMLGYIVFETGPEDGSIYMSLRDQLSSALYGAVLISERSKVKALLEETLKTMSTKAEVVSKQSELINENVTEISSSMEQVAASIREISVHINTIMQNVGSAEKLAVNATADIGELTKSSAKIAEVVGMINDIAEKTNVLALNAAIEAAHAGESGRGFNVVAKEVKELASRTVHSTAEIQTIVGKNRKDTDDTSEAIEKTRESIRIISQLSTSITAAINEQAQAASEISGLLINASQGTSEISEAINEIARLGDSIKQ